MTTIEFQNLLKSFFDFDANGVRVKDLTIRDNIIQVNDNNDNNTDDMLTGIQFLRGEKPPLNMIWNEDNQTLNFTVGSDLAKLNCFFPEVSVKDVYEDYFVKDEDILIIKKPGLKVFLPKKHNKILTIKNEYSSTILVDYITLSDIYLDLKKTYKFVRHLDKWEDIS